MEIKLTPEILGKLENGSPTLPVLDCFSKPIPEEDRVNYIRRAVPGGFVMIPNGRDVDLKFIPTDIAIFTEPPEVKRPSKSAT